MGYTEAIGGMGSDERGGTDGDARGLRVGGLPASPYRGVLDSAGRELADLVCSYSWPCEQALGVFSCESASFRLDVVYGPTVSPTNDRGIGQINAIHASKFARRGWDYYTDAFVPERNLAVAEEIYLDQGFEPWSCAH